MHENRNNDLVIKSNSSV